MSNSRCYSTGSGTSIKVGGPERDLQSIAAPGRWSGQGRRGPAREGGARPGKAGPGQGRRGPAREGEARLGKAGPGWGRRGPAGVSRWVLGCVRTVIGGADPMSLAGD